jgi:hypothetical protein
MTDTNNTTGGEYVPARLLEHPVLNPTTLHTWMLLRSHSGADGRTAALTLEQISAITGKSASTLYGHLAVLKRLGLLRWRVGSPCCMLFAYDGVEDSRKPQRAGIQGPGILPEIPETGSEIVPDAGDKGNADSRNKPEAKTQVDFPENRTDDDPESWDSEKPEALPLKHLINFFTQKDPGLKEAPFQENGEGPENLERQAVEAYRQLMGLRPNQAQRQAIRDQVRGPGHLAGHARALAGTALEPEEHSGDAGAVRAGRSTGLPLLLRREGWGRDERFG